MKGITVLLHVKNLVGKDSLNNNVFTDEVATIHNVLVGQPSAEDVTSSVSLYGKKLEYVLGIPKGDTHNWEDTEVEFFGKRFRTFGNVVEGIEANVPGFWHKKIRVARYE